MIDNNEILKLYKDWYKKLLYFARHFVVREEAEDIVQDTFVEVLELDIKDVEDQLYTMVKNNCFDRLKHFRRKRNRELIFLGKFFSDEYLDVDLLIIKTELVNLVVTRMYLLPAEQKKICKLMLYGYKNHEIAKVLNLSPNTVGVQKKRIVDQFKVLFSKY